MEGIEKMKEFMLYDIAEADDRPQEVKDVEEKFSCPTEEKNEEKNRFSINESFEEKEGKLTEDKKDKEYKEFNTNLLVLNQHFLKIMTTMTFSISIFFFEMVTLIALVSILSLLEWDYETLKNAIVTCFEKVGFKWILLFHLITHLTLGLNCLSNLTSILIEKDDPLKFYIKNIIYVIIYYIITVVVLKVFLTDWFIGKIIDEIKKIKVDDDIKNLVIDFIVDLSNTLIKWIANYAGDFNNGLDRLIMGSVYFTLFAKPKCFNENNIKNFRLLILLPLSLIFVSLFLRFLNNDNIINLSLYLNPIIIGPKPMIFALFNWTLLTIKIYERKKYKMFDDQGNIFPNVFSKIVSKVFFVFGIIEFVIGFSLSQFDSFKNFTSVGLGNHYLLVLCAPIALIYDYKKKKEIHIRPCKNKNCAPCHKLLIKCIFYGLIIFEGIYIFCYLDTLFIKYLEPAIKILIKYFPKIIDIVNALHIISKNKYYMDIYHKIVSNNKIIID